MRKPSRILGCVIGLAALMAAAACGSNSPSSESSSSSGGISGQKGVYVNYGGATLDTAKKTWFEPFNKETGAQIVGDQPSDYAKVKVMVDSGKVTWDWIDIDGASGADGCGKYFKTRKEMNIDVSAFDPKYLSDECGVPVYNTTTALVYNKEKYGNNPPTKITDFLDTTKFPGKRLTFNYAVWGLENMELAAGTAPDALYPYNYDVAKKTYDKLKKNLVIQDDLAQMSDAVTSGNFDMCFCITGRLAIAPGIDPNKVGVVWDHAWVANDLVYALKGSKVPDLQAQFMNYLAKPSTQNAFAEVQPYGPMTQGPPPNVPKDFEYWMPEFNADKTNGLSYIDYKYLAQPGVSDKANAEWTALTSG